MNNNTAVDFYYRVDYLWDNHSTFQIFIEYSDAMRFIKSRSRNRRFKLMQFIRYTAL